MKNLSRVLLLCAFAVIASLSSCKKEDPSANVSDYVGYFTAAGQCDGDDLFTGGSYEILFGLGSDEVIFTDLVGFPNDDVVATVSNFNITLAASYTNPNDIDRKWSMTGTGTLSEDYQRISIDYVLRDTYSDSDTTVVYDCTVVLTRDQI